MTDPHISEVEDDTTRVIRSTLNLLLETGIAIGQDPTIKKGSAALEETTQSVQALLDHHTESLMVKHAAELSVLDQEIMSLKAHTQSVLEQLESKAVTGNLTADTLHTYIPVEAVREALQAVREGE